METKFFTSYDIKEHCEGCDFPSDSESAYTGVKVETLDLELMLQRLLSVKAKESKRSLVNSESEKSSNINLNTFSQLYFACISNNIQHFLTDTVDVKSICVDKRSLKYWNKQACDGKML